MYTTPRTDVGPPVLNHIVSRPGLFTVFPLELQCRMAARSFRPAGAHWLVDRVAGLRITTGRTVVPAKPQGNLLGLQRVSCLASLRLTAGIWPGRNMRGRLWAASKPTSP